MPGEDHPAGRRGASAPYGDRKLWDFFVHNLLGAEPPNWNAMPATTRVGSAVKSGSAFAGLFDQAPSWDDVLAAWKQ